MQHQLFFGRSPGWQPASACYHCVLSATQQQVLSHVCTCMHGCIEAASVQLPISLTRSSLRQAWLIILSTVIKLGLKQRTAAGDQRMRRLPHLQALALVWVWQSRPSNMPHAAPNLACTSALSQQACVELTHITC